MHGITAEYYDILKYLVTFIWMYVRKHKRILTLEETLTLVHFLHCFVLLRVILRCAPDLHHCLIIVCPVHGALSASSMGLLFTGPIPLQLIPLLSPGAASPALGAWDQLHRQRHPGPPGLRVRLWEGGPPPLCGHQDRPIGEHWPRFGSWPLVFLALVWK